jgi:hypothetical protein
MEKMAAEWWSKLSSLSQSSLPPFMMVVSQFTRTRICVSQKTLHGVYGDRVIYIANLTELQAKARELRTELDKYSGVTSIENSPEVR